MFSPAYRLSRYPIVQFGQKQSVCIIDYWRRSTELRTRIDSPPRFPGPEELHE